MTIDGTPTFTIRCDQTGSCICPACCRARYPEHVAEMTQAFDAWYDATEYEWDCIIAGTLDDDQRVDAALRYVASLDK